MADSVDSLVLISEQGRHVVLLTNVSDSTGESAVTKVDLSGLVGMDGLVPVAADIMKIKYDISGFDTVQLLWNHSTNDRAITLGDAGEIDFTEWGGLKDPMSATTGDATNGDILLTTTTVAVAAADTYAIVLDLKLRTA